MEQVKRKRGRPIKQESEQYLDIPLDEIASVDLSEENTNKIANGFFIGDKAIGRRNDVRKMLEEKVVGKIGKKGKLLTDKLFELVEGIHVVGKVNTVNGVKEVVAYEQPPNLNAIIYAIDRVLGKPKQFQVQANFSLSKLLIGYDNGKGNNIRQEDNNDDAEESPVFHQNDMENSAATS